MAYIWFNSVLEALGKRINFESISALYGNSFCKDATKYIQEANPLIKNGGKKAGGIMDLAASIKIVDGSQDKAGALDAVQRSLGDISWAALLFGGKTKVHNSREEGSDNNGQSIGIPI